MYYPFGMRVEAPAGGDVCTPMTVTNRWRFSGKEEQTLMGEDLLDFGARFYDSRLGRWTTTDPLAEKYYSVSPYAYCAGNPVMFVDPDGRKFTDYYNLKGKYIGTINDGKDDSKIIIVDNTSIDDAITQKAVFPVPSAAVLSNMELAFSETEKNGKEHGFQVDIAGTSGQMGEGDEGSIMIPKVYATTGNYVEYDVHTHPQVPCDSNSSYPSNATPSSADKENVVGNSPNVVLGYQGYNGYHTRMIGFYNKNGKISETSFASFSKGVRKIHKQNLKKE